MSESYYAAFQLHPLPNYSIKPQSWKLSVDWPLAQLYRC